MLQEYTEELYKNVLNDPENQDGVIPHLEPNSMECEVKRALGSLTMNQVNGGNGIPGELFKILNDYAIKALYSGCQQIWETKQ